MPGRPFARVAAVFLVAFAPSAEVGADAADLVLGCQDRYEEVAPGLEPGSRASFSFAVEGEPRALVVQVDEVVRDNDVCELALEVDIYAIRDGAADELLATADESYYFDTIGDCANVSRLVPPGRYRAVVRNDHVLASLPWRLTVEAPCARTVACHDRFDLAMPEIPELRQNHVLLRLLPHVSALLATTNAGRPCRCAAEIDTTLELFALDEAGAWTLEEFHDDIDLEGNLCSRVDHAVAGGYLLLRDAGYRGRSVPAHSLSVHVPLCGICGDGFIDVGEGCDDGNDERGDGCSRQCEPDPCWSCAGEPSVCTELAPGSSCDNGAFCDGADSCENGECTPTGEDPCAGLGGCRGECNEEAGLCAAAAGTACEPDDDGCTLDVCDGLGACSHRLDTESCPPLVDCEHVLVAGPDPSNPASEQPFFFSVGVEESFVLETESSPGMCVKQLDTELRLYSIPAEGGEAVFFKDDDGGIDKCSRLEVTLAAQRYVAFVEWDPDRHATFLLTVRPAACPACGNGQLEGEEECDDGDATFEPGEICGAGCLTTPCGRPRGPVEGDPRPRASDALFALRAVVGSATCSSAVCDVDGDGGITAADALRILAAAVGQDVELVCPGPTASTTTTTVTATTVARPPSTTLGPASTTLRSTSTTDGSTSSTVAASSTTYPVCFAPASTLQPESFRRPRRRR